MDIIQGLFLRSISIKHILMILYAVVFIFPIKWEEYGIQHWKENTFYYGSLEIGLKHSNLSSLKNNESVFFCTYTIGF